MKKLSCVTSKILAAALLLAVSALSNATVYQLSGYGETSLGGSPVPFTIPTGSYNDETLTGTWLFEIGEDFFWPGAFVKIDQSWSINNDTGAVESLSNTGCSASPIAICDSIDYFQQHTWVLNSTPLGAGSFHLTTPSNYDIYTYITLTPVPAPAGIWLFGSAAAGLLGLRRIRTASKA